MKRSAIAILVVSLLVACGGGGSKEKANKNEATGDITQHPDYINGFALITKSDCLTCHQVEKTVTGPPYRDIANKYGGMPDTIITHLAGKIISGGNGVWGQIFMTPHPNLSKTDAETMVKYILLLKNK